MPQSDNIDPVDGESTMADRLATHLSARELVHATARARRPGSRKVSSRAAADSLYSAADKLRAYELESTRYMRRRAG